MARLPVLIGDYLHRFGPVLRRFKDMLDGTHAEVVAVAEVEAVVQVTNGPLTPTAYTLELDQPDTEFSITLPPNFGFEFRSRGMIDVRFAFETGHVADLTAPYLTLPGYWDHYQAGQFDEVTLYFATDSLNPIVIEIIVLELAV